MKKHIAFIYLVAGFAMTGSQAVIAQSSVTLYGVVDTGIAYANSQASLGSTSGGRSVVKMSNGVWSASKFGLLGSEDLGNRLKAIFKLESGYNSATGAQQYTNAMFGRTAYVGLSQPMFGTLTLGRQYAAYLQALLPYSPTNNLTGYFGAHPGDIDGLDTDYRVNNTIEYQSPAVFGFTAFGSYSELTSRVVYEQHRDGRFQAASFC